MADFDWGSLISGLAKAGVGVAGTLSANQATQDAYRSVLDNLKQRFGEYDALKTPDYKQLSPERLGPSALSGIQNDAQSRADQQAAIAQLDEISSSGGLTLADKAALNELERGLNQSDTSRRKGLANDFAARGQLGAGAQLAMALQGQQAAAENANQRGESIAAQAQRRAMDAVLRKGEMSRSMSNDDYARKQRAAEAADSIARYNSSMSMDAAKANNSYAGQSYDDQLKRLQGKTNVQSSINDATMGSGRQQANTNAGLAGIGVNAVDQFGNAVKPSKSNDPSVPPPPDYQDPNSDRQTDFSTWQDEYGDRGGAADISVGEDDK